jgi:acetyl-CoA carboxylase biotin carboxyl carrier protein
MSPKELKQILQILTESDVVEFRLETADYKLDLRRGAAVLPAPTPQPAALPAPAPALLPSPSPTPAPTEPERTPAYIEVKAPIVGTFYRSPSPDAPPYVEVGSRVERGQVLCIIEAMKLMNEIESDHAGIVRKILVENGEPVEYGQTLFLLEAV